MDKLANVLSSNLVKSLIFWFGCLYIAPNKYLFLLSDNKIV